MREVYKTEQYTINEQTTELNDSTDIARCLLIKYDGGEIQIDFCFGKVTQLRHGKDSSNK